MRRLRRKGSAARRRAQSGGGDLQMLVEDPASACGEPRAPSARACSRTHAEVGGCARRTRIARQSASRRDTAYSLLAAAMLVAAVDPVRGNEVWSPGSGVGVQCDMRLPPTDFQFGPGYERCQERRCCLSIHFLLPKTYFPMFCVCPGPVVAYAAPRPGGGAGCFLHLVHVPYVAADAQVLVGSDRSLSRQHRTHGRVGMPYE